MKTFKHTLALVLILGWCSSFSCGQSPDTDRFWTRGRIAWTAAHASAASYDVWTTRRNLNRGIPEGNPLQRPFMNRGSVGQAVSVGFSVGIDLGMSYLFHRKRGHWWRLKKFFPITLTVAHTVAGAYNHGLSNGAMP